jgi:hypothetical protein
LTLPTPLPFSTPGIEDIAGISSDSDYMGKKKKNIS